MRRIPDLFRDGIAATQARRLKLNGLPRAIVAFSPLQYPLARALLARHPEAEIWYALDPAGPPEDPALNELHDAAVPARPALPDTASPARPSTAEPAAVRADGELGSRAGASAPSGSPA